LHIERVFSRASSVPSNNLAPSTNLPEVRVIFPHVNEKGSIGSDGYEWIVFPPGSQNNFYRVPGEDWKPWEQ
jgi:hypothetical protein